MFRSFRVLTIARYFLVVIIFFCLADFILRVKYRVTISLAEPCLFSFNLPGDTLNQLRIAQTVPVANGADFGMYYTAPSAHLYGSIRNESKDLLQTYTQEEGNDDLLIVWNYNYLKKCFCDKNYNRRVDFDNYGGFVYAFPGYDSSELPVYRYFQASTLGKSRLRFNKYGWGGDNVELKKDKRTIRIAFLGGSTTQQSGECNLAYPDYVGYWLNEWARRTGKDVQFEIINAARVAERSMDFKAILKYEVLPASPDVVIYYEGRNQFWPQNMYTYQAKVNAYDPYNSWKYAIVGRSILLQRACLMLNADYITMFEPCKANVTLTEQGQKSPLEIEQIEKDLDDIKLMCDSTRAKFVLCNFAMLTNDSVLRQPRYGSVYGYLLHDFGFLPNHEIEYWMNFENAFFKSYAAKNEVPFIDVQRYLCQSPESYVDAIHLSCSGLKLHAWIVFNQLGPMLNAWIKSGELPNNLTNHFVEHPFIKENAFKVNLNEICKTP